jgi:hypothetical protein
VVAGKVKALEAARAEYAAALDAKARMDAVVETAPASPSLLAVWQRACAECRQAARLLLECESAAEPDRTMPTAEIVLRRAPPRKQIPQPAADSDAQQETDQGR